MSFSTVLIDASLPVISLKRLRDPASAAAEIARLRHVTHEIGFFYLADHGVTQERMSVLFDVAKQFFALPPAEKELISMRHNPHYRGYSRVGEELTSGIVDMREQLDYGAQRPALPAEEHRPWNVLEGPNPWPQRPEALRGLVEQWLDDLSVISMELLRAWAQSLGHRADLFDSTFDHPHPMMKLVHYPPQEAQEEAAAGHAQGVGAHKDSGVLTLLLPEPGSQGLQVLRDGRWLDVEAIPGLFVVNIGELLEAATEGYLVATPHRVLPSTPGTPRYSIPFFLTPNLDQPFPRVPVPAQLWEQSARPGGRRGRGQDMSNQEIFDISGKNTLKSRLRAHPETTQRFHQELAARFSAPAVV